MFVELTTGVLIDGAPVGAGMRVGCPDDIGGYLLERGWAIKAPRAHDAGGRPLLALRVRALPGADVPLSDWPDWMRPAWMRPEGRAEHTGTDRVWVPVACPGCSGVGYVPKARVPADARKAVRGDAWPVLCAVCDLRR